MLLNKVTKQCGYPVLLLIAIQFFYLNFLYILEIRNILVLYHKTRLILILKNKQ